MITGEETPDKGDAQPRPDGGACLRGPGPRATSTRTKSVWESISGGQDQIALGKALVNSRAYAARFNFLGPDQQKKVGCSRGASATGCTWRGCCAARQRHPAGRADERSGREHHARSGGRPRPFRRMPLVISHDRWFLDRIATHILAFEGESKVCWFEGNWSEYDADRNAASAPQPSGPTGSATAR